MSDIKYHKTFWKRSTMEIITYTEGSLSDIIQLARKDILSLITTIESQNSQIESLKAITELAVKAIGRVIEGDFIYLTDQRHYLKNTLSEIERLTNGTT